jgi:hypothetical protein
LAKPRGDFEAHATIAPLRLEVNRLQDIGCVLDIAHRDAFVERLGIDPLRLRSFEHVPVVAAAGNGLLEDGRIRGQAAQTILLDRPFKFAAGDQTAAEIVQLYGLAVVLQ